MYSACNTEIIWSETYIIVGAFNYYRSAQNIWRGIFTAPVGFLIRFLGIGNAWSENNPWKRASDHLLICATFHSLFSPPLYVFIYADRSQWKFTQSRKNNLPNFLRACCDDSQYFYFVKKICNCKFRRTYARVYSFFPILPTLNHQF